MHFYIWSFTLSPSLEIPNEKLSLNRRQIKFLIFFFLFRGMYDLLELKYGDWLTLNDSLGHIKLFVAIRRLEIDKKGLKIQLNHFMKAKNILK